MPIKDRNPAIRAPRIQRGDPITARYLNNLGEGINELLGSLAPARSLNVRSNASQLVDLETYNREAVIEGTEENPLDDGQNNAIVWTKVSSVTTILRVFSDVDPEVYVDVEYDTEITFEHGGEFLTLKLS